MRVNVFDFRSKVNLDRHISVVKTFVYLRKYYLVITGFGNYDNASL